MEDCTNAIKEFSKDARELLQYIILNIMKSVKKNSFDWRMDQLNELINAYKLLPTNDVSVVSISDLEKIEKVIRTIERYAKQELFVNIKQRFINHLKNIQLDVFIFNING